MEKYIIWMTAGILMLLTLQAAMAAVADQGATITVPTGKFMFYYIVDYDELPRLTTTAQYWSGDATLTNTESVLWYHQQIKESILNLVFVAEGNIAAEAARTAALEGSPVTT